MTRRRLKSPGHRHNFDLKPQLRHIPGRGIWLVNHTGTLVLLEVSRAARHEPSRERAHETDEGHKALANVARQGDMISQNRTVADGSSCQRTMAVVVERRRRGGGLRQNRFDNESQQVAQAILGNARD